MEIINRQRQNARGGVWKMRQSSAYGKWKNNEKCKRNMVTQRESKVENKQTNEKKLDKQKEKKQQQ